MLDFNTIFLYFMVYSIIGWCTEMVYCRIVEGHFSDRGFLYGPYCPIYGFGGLIILIFLAPCKDNPIVLFLLAVLLTTILEYVTGFLMEKIFNAKWWDYSQMKFNLNGRICLLNSILFGIFGVVVTYFVHPYIAMFLGKIPTEIVPKVIDIILVILSIDFAFSLSSVLNLKAKLSDIKEIADSLKEKRKTQDNHYISQLENLKAKLSQKRSFETNRLIKAFPDLKFNKLNDELTELKKYLNEKKEKSIEERKQRKENRKNKKQINKENNEKEI